MPARVPLRFAVPVTTGSARVISPEWFNILLTRNAQPEAAPRTFKFSRSTRLSLRLIQILVTDRRLDNPSRPFGGLLSGTTEAAALRFEGKAGGITCNELVMRQHTLRLIGCQQGEAHFFTQQRQAI